MTGATDLPTTQLIVFRFGPEARFEGGLVGALQRIEAGGAIRILDALFVRREPDGEVTVLPLRGGGAGGGLVATALEVRLDSEKRRRFSADALAEDRRLSEFREALGAGEGLAAILVEHRWAGALSGAAERMDGAAAIVEFVDASSLDELLPTLLVAARPA